jgi:hypothetical protein
MSGGFAVDDVIVVVPGMLGSRLQRDGRTIWGGRGTFESLAVPAHLALTGDGHRPEPDVRPSGLVTVPVQIPGLAKVDAYTGLLRLLSGPVVPDQRDVMIFAYDWRLSCAANGALLADQVTAALTARRADGRDGKVVFVAHSMGGLVVQHFTDVLGGSSVTRRVISIGTPFMGAVKALGTLSGGLLPWLAGTGRRTRTVLQTFPSVYELLPRYRAVLDGGSLRRLAAGDLPPDADLSLFEAATRFHDRLEADPARGYDRTVVVGVSQTTPQFAVVAGGETRLLTRCRLAGGEEIDRRGDGTVPRQASIPVQWASDADAVPFPQRHIALPSTRGVGRILSQVFDPVLRAEQSTPRAILALEVADAVEAGRPLVVDAEVVAGDHGLPLHVRVESVAGGFARRALAKPEDGRLRARFEDLPLGDLRVIVEPASRRVPDVQPVWDLITVLPRPD